MNQELLGVQTGFRKGRGTRDQIANIWWIIKKQENTRKHLLLLHWLQKSFECVDHNKLWKILKEMRIPDHLICLPRNLYAGQEATVRTGLAPNWERSTSGLYIVTCLFNLHAEYIIQNAKWMKHKLESRLPREISITSNIQMTPPLWRKVKRN